MTLPQFIESNLLWHTTLQSQIATRTLATDNTVLLGTIGAGGAIIERVHAQRAGDAVQTVVLVFVKKPTGTKILYEELQIPTLTGAIADTEIPAIDLTLPNLLTPVGGKGLRLEPGLEVWVALSVAVASPISLFFTGGNLSAN